MKDNASKQPPKPPKGASPAQIKAWISECRAQMTPIQAREYEEAGEALHATFDNLGFDPTASTFAPRAVFVDVDPTSGPS